MIRKLTPQDAYALARKYGFNLHTVLASGVKTFVQAQTGAHDLVVCRYPNTLAASITNTDGKTVERFNFSLNN